MIDLWIEALLLYFGAFLLGLAIAWWLWGREGEAR